MAKKIYKGVFLVLLALIIFSLSVNAHGGGVFQNASYCNSDISSYDVYLSPLSDGSAVSCFGYFNKIGMSPNSNIFPSGLPKPLKLYVGGMPFGVKFLTRGVSVVGFCDMPQGVKNPAATAGIGISDLITKIDGKEISGASDLTRIVESSGGRALDVSFTRSGKEHKTTLVPYFSQSEQKYKTGVYVRDSGAGIGTVTFIVPETYAFGGLGHGICDAQSGNLVAMQRGSVVGVNVNGVVRGLVGSPGEIKGYFTSGKTGTLLTNTDCGVFGMFAERPSSIHTEPMDVGLRSEVCSGEAYIYCTLDESGPQKYKIEISNIKRDSTTNKCFTVKVSDPALIEKSGGIVQGMSGSPIIQNGKLIGAVTHVMINDPTVGYGIFIDNMINQMGDLVG